MVPARLLAVVLLALPLSACKDGLVEPERYGSIQGRVLDRETSAPVAGASVTTSPATGAFLTDDDGTFRVDDVLTGSYTIAASRRGYDPNTVTVAVRDGQTTTAEFFLEAEGAGEPAVEFGAEVLGFANEAFAARSGADSTFVTVEYRALNRGDVDLARYEVYFRIDTDRGPFYQEIAGEGLEAGQLDFGTFRKYLLGARASAVVVLDTSASEAEGS
jgi:hypothetical protein